MISELRTIDEAGRRYKIDRNGIVFNWRGQALKTHYNTRGKYVILGAGNLQLKMYIDDLMNMYWGDESYE